MGSNVENDLNHELEPEITWDKKVTGEPTRRTPLRPIWHPGPRRRRVPHHKLMGSADGAAGGAKNNCCKKLGILPLVEGEGCEALSSPGTSGR